MTPCLAQSLIEKKRNGILLGTCGTGSKRRKRRQALGVLFGLLVSGLLRRATTQRGMIFRVRGNGSNRRQLLFFPLSWGPCSRRVCPLDLPTTHEEHSRRQDFWHLACARPLLMASSCVASLFLWSGGERPWVVLQGGTKGIGWV
jgi:hypothetical protein